MSMTEPDTRNTNSLWCSVLAESLYRCGLRQVVVSPGSRSTPLTFAFARHEGIEAIPVLDERSASFFALGLAKSSGLPVGLVCTSGTAAANYLPAVVEASESDVPLLVMTADRPPELRFCGAGQTIDQVKLFGDYPRYQQELPCPNGSMKALRYLRQSLVYAYDRSRNGPVHLNLPFRDPLPPLPEAGQALEAPGASFFEGIEIIPNDIACGGSVTLSGTRGLIVVGTESPHDVEAYVDAVAELSRKSGWPVLAEALSPVRNYASRFEHLVCAYDGIVRCREVSDTLKPDAILCIGPLPTSKALRQWLSESDCHAWFIHEGDRNRDALLARTRHVTGRLEGLLGRLEFTTEQDPDYSATWMRLEAKAQAFLTSALDQQDDLHEASVCRLLAHHLPEGTPLYLASSMPVRDMEYFWPAQDRGIIPFFSRGANGIDGTLSTALGVAHRNAPSVLLSGDLALLHDANGALISKDLKGSLTVVLINNEGGGIFSHLPVSQFEPPFTKYFATPQQVDFVAWARAFGIAHSRVSSLEELAAKIKDLPESGVRILEINTIRDEESSFRKQLFNHLSKHLSAS